MTDVELTCLRRGIPLERRAAAEIETLTERLKQIVTVCEDNAAALNPALALKFVREIAATR